MSALRRHRISLAYRDAVLATNPVSYWRLGEASGTVARDEMGLNHGTYVNTPTLGAAGLLTGDSDTAATFAEASAQSILIKNARILSGLPAFSVGAWFDHPSASASSRAIYAERGAGNDLLMIEFNDSGAIVFYFRGDSGALDAVTTDGTYYGAGRHLLVATKSGTSYTCYVDGPPVKTATLAATDTFTGAVTTYLASDQGASDFLNGTLDESAIWDRAVTPAEIAYLHRVGMGR